MALELLFTRDHVLKSQDAVDAGEIETVADRRDAEATLEGALGHAEALGRWRADQEQLADLIGSQRQRGPLGVQPAGKSR